MDELIHFVLSALTTILISIGTVKLLFGESERALRSGNRNFIWALIIFTLKFYLLPLREIEYTVINYVIWIFFIIGILFLTIGFGNIAFGKGLRFTLCGIASLILLLSFDFVETAELIPRSS
jgi:hypothetical protein